MEDHQEYDEGVLRENPPWLYLLYPAQRAWRQNEVLKGRNPDGYIEKQLREAGEWPKDETKS